jgi:protein-S-isoprenylcysteine O-methyltransferase Ste14
MWWRELRTYVGRIRDFDRTDWAAYLAWVGLMFGLVAATGGLLLVGHRLGVRFPPEAWLLPIGALIFAISIAIDTIGHRTIYKQ